MRTIVYELTGKDVPAGLAGAKINIAVAETLAEAESQTVKGTSDVVAKFTDGRVISIQGGLRNRAAKALKDANGNATAATESLQKFATEYRYTEREEGEGGVAAPKTAKGRQTKAAASSGNRLFEKCLADEQFLARMVKQGIVDQAEFDTWRAAREEAAKAEAEKAAK